MLTISVPRPRAAHVIDWVYVARLKRLFNPLVGSSYAAYNGCYYYKIGNRVHLHIGVNGLTPDKDATVFYMPAGYRPYGNIHVKGEANGVSSIASARISQGGGVMVNSEMQYALIDAFYDAFY